MKALAEIDWARIDAFGAQDQTAVIAKDPDTRDAKTLRSEDASVVWPRVDVKALRERIGLTQREFARRFAIPKRSLENWEQERRDPDIAVNIYLQLIARHPGVIAALVDEARRGLLAEAAQAAE